MYSGRTWCVASTVTVPDSLSVTLQNPGSLWSIPPEYEHWLPPIIIIIITTMNDTITIRNTHLKMTTMLSYF